MPDLQEQLRALADRRADETVGDFDGVVSTARSRKHRRTAGWSAALAVAVVAVVGSQVVSRPDVVPAGPPPDQQLVLTPASVRPGERFVATVPSGVSLGLSFGMVPVDGSLSTYALRAQAPGITAPAAAWQTNHEPATGLVIPSYLGPGPFDLFVSPRVEPGRYRVCNQGVCGLLTVR
jgi:hypothetical protein